ncbi:hypothetical protein Pmar_PMAR007716, partial [Perkinsus marinus ATCC 50983]
MVNPVSVEIGSPRESGPAGLDELLNKFNGVSASLYRPSEVIDAVAGVLDLLPPEHQLRGQKVLQVLTRHHLTLIEGAARPGSILTPPHRAEAAPSAVLASLATNSSNQRADTSHLVCTAREAPTSVPEPSPAAQPSHTWTVVAATRGPTKRMRVPGSTPVHHRTIVTPTVPAARGKGKGNGKGKGTTAPGPNRTALEKAKKANKKACVVELRSVDDDAKMDAAEFMTFRSRALGLLSGSVIVNTTFPIKGGIGLVLSDESHGNACVQSLSRMQGYTAKVRTGLWPRVILFNPAIARGSTIDSVSRSIKEGNPALTEGIDGDKLVSAVYWRGQHLVMAICPTLYHRLSANGEGKGRL